MKSIQVITSLFLFSMSLAAPALATSVPSPALVCKNSGTAPASGDPSCTASGGLIVMTGFFTSSYDQCVTQAAEADQLPPHFSPWQSAKGAANDDADADAARATTARASYCRGLYPMTNNADGSTQAWVGDNYYVKIAVSLDSKENCVKRLTAGAEIPLVEGDWKTDGVDAFCTEKVKPLEDAPAGGGSGSANRVRWAQVGGNWTSDWVPTSGTPACVHGGGCECNGEKVCGTYKPGTTTSYWPFGCQGPKWTLRCEQGNADKDDAGGSGTWRPVGAVNDANIEACQLVSYNQTKKPFATWGGSACTSIGKYCRHMTGNLISGGLVFHYYQCK